MPRSSWRTQRRSADRKRRSRGKGRICSVCWKVSPPVLIPSEVEGAALGSEASLRRDFTRSTRRRAPREITSARGVGRQESPGEIKNGGLNADETDGADPGATRDAPPSANKDLE